jgi:hypothetical protein
MKCLEHHANNNKQKMQNVNDKKVKGTGELLTQFGDKHTYSGDYQVRKEIHQCSPYSKFSANSQLTT